MSGFKGNDSNEQIVADIKLYTGLVNGTPVLFNPTLAQLQEAGINTDKDPIYELGEDDQGNKKIAIDIWMKFEFTDRLQKMRLFLTNTPRVSNDKAKAQFIDKTGKTCWDLPANKGEGYKWFDSESARECLVGEDMLTDFMIKWLNIKPGDIARFADMSEIFKFNLADILEAKKAYPTNQVRVMLTVNHADGGKQYQNIYTRYFDRANITSTKYWEDHINGATAKGYPMKDSFSYIFQEYKPDMPTTDTAVPADPKADLF